VFWQVKRLPLSEGYYRISDTSESVLTCQVQDSCVGGNDTAAYCGEGYRGVMCASCEKGYFQTFGNVCVQCTQTKKLLGASPLLIILGIVVLFAVVQLPGYMGFDIAANVQVASTISCECLTYHSTAAYRVLREVFKV
jgi:amino acid transporter